MVNSEEDGSEAGRCRGWRKSEQNYSNQLRERSE